MEFDNRIIRKIVERNFSYADLNPRKYSDLDMIKNNIPCPYHEHSGDGNAKFYFDENKQIYILHCWVEHKSFSSYDYLNLIMCKQKQLYKSPLSFLVQQLGEKEVLKQYKLYEQEDVEILENNYKKKVEWINNVFDESESMTDYIERLYTA